MQFKFRFRFYVKECRFNNVLPYETAEREAGTSIQQRALEGQSHLETKQLPRAQDKGFQHISTCPGVILSFHFLFSRKENLDISISLNSCLRKSVAYFIEAQRTDLKLLTVFLVCFVLFSGK